MAKRYAVCLEQFAIQNRKKMELKSLSKNYVCFSNFLSDVF